MTTNLERWTKKKIKKPTKIAFIGKYQTRQTKPETPVETDRGCKLMSLTELPEKVKDKTGESNNPETFDDGDTRVADKFVAANTMSEAYKLGWSNCKERILKILVKEIKYEENPPMPRTWNIIEELKYVRKLIEEGVAK